MYLYYNTDNIIPKKASQRNLDIKSTRRIKKAKDSIDLRGFDLENLQVWTLGMTGFLQSVTAACILDSQIAFEVVHLVKKPSLKTRVYGIL